MDPTRLQKIAPFAALDEEAVRFIAAIASESSLAAGEELIREGDYSYELIAVCDGTARVHHGEETVAELQPGDIAGEMGVLEKSQRTASVTATTPMQVVTLTSWDVDKLRKRAPGALRALEEVVAGRRASAA